MLCNSSSSVFLNHYRTLRNKQRRGSKASGFRKQCYDGRQNTLIDTTSVAVVEVTAASCGFIFHERLFLRLSEIPPIPWFLTAGQVELEDPSTWTNRNNFESRTNDRVYLSSLIVLQSYVQILLFVHRLVCKGHFRIKNVPSLYSQFRLDVLVSWEYFRINLPWPYILDAACKYLHSSFDVSMSCKQL